MNPTTVQARRRTFEQTLLSARRTMMLSEILKLAFDSFRASKTRFALTALGMVIGTASVILVVTIGLTGKHYILSELQKIETNSVELEYAGGGTTAAERVLYNDYLTRDDERTIDEQVPGIMYSSPVLDMHEPISYGAGQVKDTLILGVSPDYQNVRNLLVPVGRFFDESDESAHIKCAVVTQAFARARYGSDDEAVGQTFEIEGIPFTIIGVFKEAVDDFGESEIADQTILIPYSVAQYFTGTENLRQIYFSMRSMNEVPEAENADQDYYSVASQAQLGLQNTNAQADADHRRRNRQCDHRGAGAGGCSYSGRGGRGHYEHHAGHCPRPDSRDRYP